MIELPIVPAEQHIKKPDWLRVKLPIGESYKHVRGLVDKHKLHTICESGNCPNMGECWGEGTATFMILGNICTRSCQFCAVACLSGTQKSSLRAGFWSSHTSCGVFRPVALSLALLARYLR